MLLVWTEGALPLAHDGAWREGERAGDGGASEDDGVRQEGGARQVEAVGKEGEGGDEGGVLLLAQSAEEGGHLPAPFEAAHPAGSAAMRHEIEAHRPN